LAAALLLDFPPTFLDPTFDLCTVLVLAILIIKKKVCIYIGTRRGFPTESFYWLFSRKECMSYQGILYVLLKEF
jgi:hypothetical protein